MGSRRNGSGRRIVKMRDIEGKIVEIDLNELPGTKAALEFKNKNKRTLHKKGGRVKK